MVDISLEKAVARQGRIRRPHPPRPHPQLPSGSPGGGGAGVFLGKVVGKENDLLKVKAVDSGSDPSDWANVGVGTTEFCVWGGPGNGIITNDPVVVFQAAGSVFRIAIPLMNVVGSSWDTGPEMRFGEPDADDLADPDTSDVPMYPFQDLNCEHE